MSKRSCTESMADAIRAARRARGLTQREAARLVPVSKTYWSYLERGTRRGDPETVARILAVLRSVT